VGARRVRARGIEPSEIDRQVANRVSARQAKDFARADAIRQELLATGIEVRDAPGGGSTWRAV